MEKTYMITMNGTQLGEKVYVGYDGKKEAQELCKSYRRIDRKHSTYKTTYKVVEVK